MAVGGDWRGSKREEGSVVGGEWFREGGGERREVGKK